MLNARIAAPRGLAQPAQLIGVDRGIEGGVPSALAHGHRADRLARGLTEDGCPRCGGRRGGMRPSSRRVPSAMTSRKAV